jgi:hypothetical protein
MVAGYSYLTPGSAEITTTNFRLAQLWLAWGIQPTAYLGHSIGEYVAACVAGVMTLEEGLKVETEHFLPLAGSTQSALTLQPLPTPMRSSGRRTGKILCRWPKLPHCRWRY